LLGDLDSPVHITVIAGADSSTEVRQLLAAYEANSPNIIVDLLDPDRRPAAYLALLEELDAGSDALASDFAAEAALIVRASSRDWLVRKNDLMRKDAEGKLHLRTEAAVTEAIARVLDSAKTRVCFVAGHGERSIDDESPEGLAELRRLLERSNAQTERVNLDVSEPLKALQNCESIVIAGPSRPLPANHVELITRVTQSQARALALFVDPIVGPRAQIRPAGLESLYQLAGARVEPSFVVEQDPSVILPSSLGEVFFAHAKVHPLTSGLTTEHSRMDARIVMKAAAPITLTEGSEAVVFLETSNDALALTSLDEQTKNQALEPPLDLAATQTKTAASRGSTELRSVVMGTSNVLSNESFRDPALYGNRVFAENAFAWVLHRPYLRSVPERGVMTAGLSLSEESLSSLMRYLLIYLPLAALSAGGAVLYLRRRRESESHGGRARENGP
jgi:hypothetical protein